MLVGKTVRTLVRGGPSARYMQALGREAEAEINGQSHWLGDVKKIKYTLVLPITIINIFSQLHVSSAAANTSFALVLVGHGTCASSIRGRDGAGIPVRLARYVEVRRGSARMLGPIQPSNQMF